MEAMTEADPSTQIADPRIAAATGTAPRGDRIAHELAAAFAPLILDVTDDSAHHAGHAGAAAGGETHYSVTLVCSAFRGMNRVARSRAVHAALAAEFASGLHALALTLRSPEEAGVSTHGRS